MRVFVAHNFRPSHHLGEINILDLCHPPASCSTLALAFSHFLAIIKLALN